MGRRKKQNNHPQRCQTRTSYMAIAMDHDLLDQIFLRLEERSQEKRKKRQQKNSVRRKSLDAMEGLIQTRNDNYLKLLTS